MKKFKYAEEVMMRIWERTEFEVEAESREEADKIVAERLKMGFASDVFDAKEKKILYGSREYISPKENGGEPTRIAYRNREDYFEEKNVFENTDKRL